MAGASVPREGNRLLGYFGLDTRAKAAEVLIWTLPYLGILLLAFGGLAYLVQLLLPLSLWVHALGTTLALLYFFLFLARVRQMGLDAARAAEQGPEPPGA